MSAADDLRQLIALRAAKERHEDALKGINGEIDTITARILDRWAEDGIDSMKVDGKLVSLRRQVWARILDRSVVAEVLREAGLDALLTPNLQSLSAYIREVESNEQELPPAFAGVIDRHERYSLSVRNGRG